MNYVWRDGIPVCHRSWPESILEDVHICSDRDNRLALMVPGSLLLDYNLWRMFSLWTLHWRTRLR